jgi:hypothetical protein
MRRGRRVRRASRRSGEEIVWGLFVPFAWSGGEDWRLGGGSVFMAARDGPRWGRNPLPSAPCSSPPRNFLDVSDAAGGSRGVFDKDGGSVANGALTWGVGVGGRQVHPTP